MYLAGADKDQSWRCNRVFLEVAEKPAPAHEPENLVKVMTVKAKPLGDKARRFLEPADEKRRALGRFRSILGERINWNFSRPWHFPRAPFHLRATPNWRVHFRSYLPGTIQTVSKNSPTETSLGFPRPGPVSLRADRARRAGGGGCRRSRQEPAQESGPDRSPR